MSRLELDHIIELLRNFARENKSALDVLLVGGLALHHYGMKERSTVDLDAEVRGDIEGLFAYLKSHRIPSDLGENFSGWSVIAMPPGYRERAVLIHQEPRLTLKVLNPVDFIHAKLRRFTEEDIQDALFVTKKFKIAAKEIELAVDEAIKNSPKDTAIFFFKNNVKIFLKKFFPSAHAYEKKR